MDRHFAQRSWRPRYPKISHRASIIYGTLGYHILDGLAQMALCDTMGNKLSKGFMSMHLLALLLPEPPALFKKASGA
jgi:hypothetical protein